MRESKNTQYILQESSVGVCRRDNFDRTTLTRGEDMPAFRTFVTRVFATNCPYSALC